MKMKMCRNDICCDLRSFKTTVDGITTCIPVISNDRGQASEPFELGSQTGIESLTRKQIHELQNGLVSVIGPNKQDIPGTDIMQQPA